MQLKSSIFAIENHFNMNTKPFLTLSSILLLCSHLTGTVISQTIRVGAEVFQSPVTLEMMHFNRNQWQIQSGNDFYRISSPVAYGVFGEYGFGGFTIISRFGYCNMAFSESGRFQTSMSGEAIHNAHSSELKQSQILFSAGLKKSYSIGKVKLGIGAETPFVVYSDGVLTETFDNVRYYAQSNNVNYEFHSTSRYELPSGVAGGLGALMELSYSPVPLIDFGVVVSAGLYRHIINKSTSLEYRTANKSYNYNGTLNTSASGISNYTLDTDLRHTFFSRLLPSFRVSYRIF